MQRRSVAVDGQGRARSTRLKSTHCHAIHYIATLLWLDVAQSTLGEQPTIHRTVILCTTRWDNVTRLRPRWRGTTALARDRVDFDLPRTSLHYCPGTPGTDRQVYDADSSCSPTTTSPLVRSPHLPSILPPRANRRFPGTSQLKKQTCGSISWSGSGLRNYGAPTPRARRQVSMTPAVQWEDSFPREKRVVS